MKEDVTMGGFLFSNAQTCSCVSLSSCCLLTGCSTLSYLSSTMSACTLQTTKQHPSMASTSAAASRFQSCISSCSTAFDNYLLQGTVSKSKSSSWSRCSVTAILRAIFTPVKMLTLRSFEPSLREARFSTLFIY